MHFQEVPKYFSSFIKLVNTSTALLDSLLEMRFLHELLNFLGRLMLSSLRIGPSANQSSHQCIFFQKRLSRQSRYNQVPQSLLLGPPKKSCNFFKDPAEKRQFKCMILQFYEAILFKLAEVYCFKGKIGREHKFTSKIGFVFMVHTATI